MAALTAPASDPVTDDLELQKRIAEEAQLPSATAASPVVRAFQFFLVPLLIVAICGGASLSP